jgi:hypothetical protein
MRFLVLGRDGDDVGAPARRQAARPQHLQALARRAAAGEMVHVAALIDDEGQMRGSVVICDFPDREALDAYLREEPYVVGDVWRSIEVQALRSLNLAELPG